MSRYFVEPDTNVYDLGCSTGSMLKQIKDNTNAKDYIGYDCAEEFKDIVYDTDVTLFNEPIQDMKITNASFVTSLFTLQFIPKQDRYNVISEVYQGLNKGGAFVIAEKIFFDQPQVQDMMTFMYYDHKRDHFSDKEILDKEYQLRDMLRPNTRDELKSMLSMFESVTTFWQQHSFVGMLCLK
jgi:tRNA (cmo5U34)-methyltransferase